MGLGLRQYAVFIGLAILLAAAFFAFRYREDPAGERAPANAAAGEESANRPGGSAGGSGAGEKAANDAAAAAARNRDPIEVEATEEGGVPLEGARVGLWPEGDTELSHWGALSRGVADIDGRAILPPTGAAPPFVLAIHPPRGRPDLLRLVVPGWRPGDPVPPVPGSLAVTGIVVDPDGRPVEGASVLCVADGYEGVGPISDAEGRFRIDGLLDGPVSLTAVPGSWSLTPAAGEPVEVRAGDDGVRLLLRPDCELSLRISPWLTNMIMTARLWTQDQPELRMIWRARFSQDGSIRVSGLRPHHRYSLLLGGGFLDRCPLVTDIRPDVPDQVIELGRGLEIGGTLDAPPDPQFLRITAYCAAEGMRPGFTAYGRIVQDGRFLIPGLFAGSWTVNGQATYRDGEQYRVLLAWKVTDAGSTTHLAFRDPAEVQEEQRRAYLERKRVKVR